MRLKKLHMVVVIAAVIAPAVTFGQAYYPGGMSNAKLKLWLDAGNAASLYSDSAKTTPASASGKIGCWKDLSGNANNFVQGDPTNAGPTWDQSSGVLTFGGAHELHRPVASANPYVVSGTGSWSVAVVMKNTAAAASPAAGTDQRVFHVGSMSPSTTGTNNSFDISTSVVANKSSGSDGVIPSNDNSTYTFYGLALRYSSEYPGNNGNGNPKSMLFRTVPASGSVPLATQMINVRDTMNIGVFAFTGNAALTTSNTNPVVRWNGYGVNVGGASTTGLAQIQTGSNQTTSIGAVRDNTTITYGFTGQVAAVLAFNAKLSATESTILSNYLNAAHTPAHSLGASDYFAQDATFRSNLVGIGYTAAGDSVGMTQTSSGGLGFGPTDVQSGVGTPSYLMMAHNGAANTANPAPVSMNGVDYYRLNRVWKVQKTAFTSGPANVTMWFSFDDFQPKTAEYTPYATDTTMYYVLQCADPAFSSGVSVAGSVRSGFNSDTQLQRRLAFSVPLGTLTSGYYTIASVKDTAFGNQMYSGSTLSGTVDNVSIPSGGSLSVTAPTEITGSLSLNSNTGVTITNSTLTINGTLKQNGGSITLNNSTLIVKTTKTYMKGAGNISRTNGGKVRYETNANLYYTGSAGTCTVGAEWPDDDGPDRVRLTGNNTVTLDKNHVVHIESRFNNGILDLNGFTLRMKGASTKTNGQIRGGVNGTAAGIIIDSTTSSFDLPQIIDGLSTLSLTGSNTGKTINLSNSVTIHDGLVLASGTLDIDGNRNNQYQKLTLNGTCSATGGSLQGGDHSDLEIGEVGTGSQAQLTLPAISGGLRNLVASRRNGAKLSSSLSVTTLVDVTSGTLDVAANTLTLGASGSISGESAAHPITGTYNGWGSCGKISTTRFLSASASESFGNLGITITTSGSIAPGSTAVSRNYSQWFCGSTNKSIMRTYTIEPAVNAGLSATLTMNYNASELDGRDPSKILVYKSTDHGAADWQQMGGTRGVNSLTYGPITSFSDWTAMDPNGTLPVELVSFTASRRDNAVALQWRTATESNSHSFEVQRRIDDAAWIASERTARQGVEDAEWIAIGSRSAAGQSSVAVQYAYSDPLGSVPEKYGSVSYRLKQIDRDGVYKMSPEVTVSLGAPAATRLHLGAPYPMPASEQVETQLTLADAAAVTLTLCTVDGRRVQTIADNTWFEAGTHSISVPCHGLQAGTYFLVMNTASARQARPVIIWR